MFKNILYFFRDIVTLYGLKSLPYRKVEYRCCVKGYTRVVPNIKEE